MPDERGILTADDLDRLTAGAADARIAYGPEPSQFGDLRLPAGSGPHPVAVLLHGGCWMARYGLDYFGSPAEALTRAGIATWSLEYRRVGQAGGGWPGTLQDVGRGTDHLRTLAQTHGLDLDRLISIGHSAGGQLAIWLAARPRLVPHSELHVPAPLPIRGVLALAPAAHLALLHAEGTCEEAVDRFLGGAPERYPERYRDSSPAELTPVGVPQILILGRHDATWRPNGEAYHRVARQAHDAVELRLAPDSGHFEMVVPSSGTWPLVEAAAWELLGGR